jgi:hypothetical protein
MDGKSTNGLTIDCCPSGRNGKATLTARRGDEVLAVELVDLTKPKARETFANAVCEGRAGVDRKELDAKLLKLAADVVSRPKETESEIQPGVPDPEALLAAMPEAVRTRARTILDDPQLVKNIVDDIGRLGVAGEKELAATIYLVGTSRLLGKPLAAIVQGPSSSGKSYLIEQVATLFPPEAIVYATQMTPQALFHMKPGSLIHRFVVAGERSRVENDDTAEATRALREMLSAGKLVKLMPMKVNGEIQTVQIQQDGPIAYVESTTLNKLFNEDANRCILLTTDERQDQTRRIIERLATNYAGVCPDGESQQVIARHHALQRMLQSYGVVVPFAERLGKLVTNVPLEARRAFPQLISMIQASTLLHQRQRKLDDDGRLVAEPDDYKLARHLLAKPMERLLGGRLSDPAHRFYERLREWVRPDEPFTTRDAMNHERGCKSSVYGWLGELHDAALVELVEAPRGRSPATWKVLVESAGEPVVSLPTVEHVFGK